MNNKKISIIIPVFNNEKYIDRCLSSICGVNEEDIEILVIDDGSTDHTANIIKKYISNYHNIQYIYQKNSGVSTARNMGLRKATGKYVFFLDSDDYLSKNGISELIRYADGKNDLVVFPYVSVKSEKNEYENKKIKHEKIKIVENSDELIKDALINRDVVFNFGNQKNMGCQDMRSSCSKLIKLNIIQQNNISFNKDIVIAEDMIFMLQVYTCIKNALFVNRIVYFYWQNNNSAINSYHSNYLNNILIVNSYIEKITQKRQYDFNEAVDYYKLNDIILYLKYDIFNKKNKDARAKKYYKINAFLNEFNYKRIFNNVKHSNLYKSVEIKKRLFYRITLYRLFIVDEILFYFLYK
ncbi:glycosyltransferase family 2 protein [Lactobacillus helveticus]|uniref:glycosyltransferase family 2 protein n=1 Tax=Lactobacillus helveticus TaxID=1587 RepID=UPI001563AFE8|nr:glycosyltransferase family 2 protein [Lactobacillus helveticus]NRO80837.1 putative glycosyltransferase EpsJ [Lactobacillus helveticus]